MEEDKEKKEKKETIADDLSPELWEQVETLIRQLSWGVESE